MSLSLSPLIKDVVILMQVVIDYKMIIVDLPNFGLRSISDYCTAVFMVGNLVQNNDTHGLLFLLLQLPRSSAHHALATNTVIQSIYRALFLYIRIR